MDIKELFDKNRPKEHSLPQKRQALRRFLLNNEFSPQKTSLFSRFVMFSGAFAVVCIIAVTGYFFMKPPQESIDTKAIKYKSYIPQIQETKIQFTRLQTKPFYSTSEKPDLDLPSIPTPSMMSKNQKIMLSIKPKPLPTPLALKKQNLP